MSKPLTLGMGTVDPYRPWEETLAMASHAEECGFDSICMHDHPNFPGIDPIAGLSAVATQTSKIRLWTNVLAVPYRSPSVLAHQMASVDVISGGRLILGLGTGWDEREFTAYDLPFANGATRRAQVIDAIHIARTLWADGRGTYEGTTSSVRDAVCEPKPIQKPPPIWIGSHNGPKALAEIVVPLADGWNIGIPSTPGAPTIEEAVANFWKLCESGGRDPDEITLSTNLLIVGSTGVDEGLKTLQGPAHIEESTKHFSIHDLPRLVGRIEHLYEIGITHMMLGVTSSKIMDDLSVIADQLVKPLRG